jgi:hypothetical protein
LFLQTFKEQNTYFQRNITVSGDLSGLLMDNLVRRNLTQRVEVLLLKAIKKNLIGCSVDVEFTLSNPVNLAVQVFERGKQSSKEEIPLNVTYRIFNFVFCLRPVRPA